MVQKSQNKCCAQDSALKLLAKFHQNPKSVNKVIAQLVKNFKSLFFHCDTTDDINSYAYDNQHYLNICEKAQVKQLTWNEVITKLKQICLKHKTCKM